MLSLFRRIQRLALFSLLAMCASGDTRVTRNADRWIVENSELRVTVDAVEGTLEVLEKAGRVTWAQAPVAPRAPFAEVRELS